MIGPGISSGLAITIRRPPSWSTISIRCAVRVSTNDSSLLRTTERLYKPRRSYQQARATLPRRFYSLPSIDPPSALIQQREHISNVPTARRKRGFRAPNTQTRPLLFFSPLPEPLPGCLLQPEPVSGQELPSTPDPNPCSTRHPARRPPGIFLLTFLHIYGFIASP